MYFVLLLLNLFEKIFNIILLKKLVLLENKFNENLAIAMLLTINTNEASKFVYFCIFYFVIYCFVRCNVVVRCSGVVSERSSKANSRIFGMLKFCCFF